MSIYVISGRTITNTQKSANPDISTQNEYNSTWVGFSAGARNTGYNNTFYGYMAGSENEAGSSNTFVGHHAGKYNSTGQVNTFLGAGAGEGNVSGKENIFIGHKAGFHNTGGINNVFMGNNAGQYLSGGTNNVLIGHNNTNTTTNPAASHNVSIGANSIASGYMNEILGTANVAQGAQSTIVGRHNQDSSSNSVLIGGNIRNYGQNAFIVMTQCNSFENRSNNIININGALLAGGFSHGRFTNMAVPVASVLLGNPSSSNGLWVSSSNTTLQTPYARLSLAVAATNTTSLVCQGPLQLMSGSNQVMLSSKGMEFPTGMTFQSVQGGISLQSLSNATSYVALLDTLGGSNNNGNLACFSRCNIQVTSSNNVLCSSTCNMRLQAGSHLQAVCGSQQLLLDATSASADGGTPIASLSSSNHVCLYTSSNRVCLHQSHGVHINTPYDQGVKFELGAGAGNSNATTLLITGDNTHTAGVVLSMTGQQQQLTPSIHLTDQGIALSVSSNTSHMEVRTSNVVFHQPVVFEQGLQNLLRDETASFSNTLFTNSNFMLDFLEDMGFSFALNNQHSGSNTQLIAHCCSNALSLSHFYDTQALVDAHQGSLVVHSNLLVAGTFACTEFRTPIASLQSCDILRITACNGIVFDAPFVKLPSGSIIRKQSDDTGGGSGSGAGGGSALVVVACHSNLTYNDFVEEEGNGLGVDEHLASLAVKGNVFVGGTLVCDKFQTPLVSLHACDQLTISACNAIVFDAPYVRLPGDVALSNSVVSASNVSAGLVSACNVSVAGGLQVTGPASVQGVLTLQDPTTTQHSSWEQFIDQQDLVFRSSLGTTVTFVEDFVPGVLNFTGKHRCTLRHRPSISNNSRLRRLIGRIVVSRGVYRDLKDQAQISIDEALPVVQLSRCAHDKRVFGVIGGFDNTGSFSLGNLRFTQQLHTTKCIVQSAGEGAIWVCDAGGELRNGDYITTSPVPGYGMRQKDCLRRNSTVAKITAHCTFCEAQGDTKLIKHRKKVFRARLVGCVYACN